MKNARAKLAENFLGRLQNLLIRYREGWSGQNMTALGPSSRPSPELLSRNAKLAPTAAEAMDWLRAKQLAEYNGIPFKTRGGRPCNQTPEQLWAALPSATAELRGQQLAMYAGRSHRVKLTKRGLTVHADKQAFSYYPKVRGSEARAKALRTFAELKVRSPEGSKRTLYILDYSEGAYVFDKPWEEGGKYKGYWPLQQKVSMAETLGGSHLSALQGHASFAA